MRSSSRLPLCALLAGVMSLVSPMPALAQDGEAVAVVEGLHAALLDIMKNADSLGYAGRRDRIAPVVEKSFDLKFISRFVLGSERSSLNDRQQKKFRDVFTRWTIANYAARFNGYAGERFETLSSDESRQGREIVRTVLVMKDDPAGNVTLDYLLRLSVGKWRIINVIANGVSDLSLKRADYGAVMKSQGFQSLLDKLEAQIAEFESAG